MSEKIKDIYTEDAWNDLLREAKENADYGFEQDFLASLEERFEKYGMGSYLSEKQRAVLLRIAGRE
jgi:hypothetical protein